VRDLTVRPAPRSANPTSIAAAAFSPVAGSVCELPLPDDPLPLPDPPLPLELAGDPEPPEPEPPDAAPVAEDWPPPPPAAWPDPPEPVTTTVPCINGWILQK